VEPVEIIQPELRQTRIVVAPRFNVPEIIQAIRQVPVQAQAEMLRQHTREIITGMNIPDMIRKVQVEQKPKNDDQLLRSLDSLNKKMQVMDELNTTLKAGIRSKIVYTEWDEMQRSIEEMIADSGA
jgi:hypothetical protein